MFTNKNINEFLGVPFKVTPNDTPVFDDFVYTIKKDDAGNYYCRCLDTRTITPIHVEDTGFTYGVVMFNRLHLGFINYSQIVAASFTSKEYYQQLKASKHANTISPIGETTLLPQTANHFSKHKEYEQQKLTFSYHQ